MGKKMDKLNCKFEKDGFCTAFVCYSSEQCIAKTQSGKPLYSDYKSLDDIKHNKKGGEEIKGKYEVKEKDNVE